MIEPLATLAGKEPIAPAEALDRFRAIFNEDGADGFLGHTPAADELREIGRRLAVAGGFRLMQDAWHRFQGRNRDRERRLAASPLSWRSDGVGGWLC